MQTIEDMRQRATVPGEADDPPSPDAQAGIDSIVAAIETFKATYPPNIFKRRPYKASLEQFAVDIEYILNMCDAIFVPMYNALPEYMSQEEMKAAILADEALANLLFTGLGYRVKFVPLEEFAERLGVDNFRLQLTLGKVVDRAHRQFAAELSYNFFRQQVAWSLMEIKSSSLQTTPGVSTRVYLKMLATNLFGAGEHFIRDIPFYNRNTRPLPEFMQAVPRALEEMSLHVLRCSREFTEDEQLIELGEPTP